MNAHSKVLVEQIAPASLSFGKYTRSLARECLAASNNERDGAAKLFQARLLSDAEFCRLNIDRLVSAFASQTVGEVLTMDRTAIIRSVSVAPSVDGSRLRAAIEAEVSRMMDMPIWGGKRIADATSDEIRDSANQYDRAALDMQRKARWQIMVADALDENGGDIVRNALSEPTLVKLWEKTSGN